MTIFLRLTSIFKSHIAKIFILILCFLFSFSFSFESFAQFSTILEGKMLPASSYEIVIEYQYQYLTFQPKRQLITTNEKGEFNFTIPLKKSTWLLWKCKDKQGQIYLHVGDSLNMQVELGALPYGTKFSGLGAAENNFLQKWETEFGNSSKNTLYPKKYKNSNEKNFKSEVEKLRKNQFKLLEETIGKKPLSDDFILAMEQRIAYENANHLAEYSVLHAFLNEQTPKILSDEYYSFFEETIIQSPSALNQPAYLRFLRNYLEFRYIKSHQETSLKAYSDLYYPLLFEITEKELLGSVQAHAQSILIIELAKQGNEKLYKKYYKKYLSIHKDDKSASVLKEFIENSQKMKIGKLAPNFSLPDATGATVKLSDFRGKIVYLFFGSLESEFIENYLKGFEYLNNQIKNQTENKSNQIVFLWIQTAKLSSTISSNNKNLETRFKELNITSLTCYFSDTLGYNLNGLPSAFLIDKKGKLVYSDTKLPSDIGLLEDISYFLND
ncbi:redoxin domain-containing protein (plasmid) [Bernardetia sp. Wsw4-3y2]|uniref:peroxiredoxin family protein n=1 Tax=Bernardetia sp. Wsw4-3y2 TaxID=3127471 RepID=UPI0030D59BAE